jgi:adenosylhomocysteine nucleosidase
VTSPPPILVVTGLAREARIASGLGIAVVKAGGDPARLRALLEAESALAYRAIISFGIAGGLDPALAPGHVVIASGVVAGGERWPSHPAVVRLWTQCLENSGQRITLADIAGAGAPLLSASDKGALRAATGAAAVDMESHVAADFAVARGLPFAAIRVVCDPAERTLPPLAGEALRPDGSLDMRAVVGSLARRPAQVAALPRLARDASAAFAALRRVRAALGPGFGLGSLGFGEALGNVL